VPTARIESAPLVFWVESEERFWMQILMLGSPVKEARQPPLPGTKVFSSLRMNSMVPEKDCVAVAKESPLAPWTRVVTFTDRVTGPEKRMETGTSGGGAWVTITVPVIFKGGRQWNSKMQK